MKKIIYVLMGLLIISTALAIEKYKEFELPIKIRTDDCKVNITIDNDEKYNYDCNNTDINIFEYGFGEVVEFDCGTEAIDASNFSESVDKMAETCNKITEAYGDVSSYYTLYVNCNANLSVCKTNLENQKSDILTKTETEDKAKSCQTELDKIKTSLNERILDYDKCELERKQLTTDLTNCESNLWIYGIIGAILGAIASWGWFVGRFKIKTKTDVDRTEMR